MSFFNDVGSFASDLANKAGRKSRVLANTTRLNMKVAGLEDTVKRSFTEIGRLYYEAYELGEVVGLDVCVPHCEAVADAKQQITETKAEIDRIKAEDKSIDEQEARAKSYSAADAEYVDIFDEEVPAASEDEASAPVETDFGTEE